MMVPSNAFFVAGLLASFLTPSWAAVLQPTPTSDSSTENFNDALASVLRPIITPAPTQEAIAGWAAPGTVCGHPLGPQTAAYQCRRNETCIIAHDATHGDKGFLGCADGKKPPKFSAEVACVNSMGFENGECDEECQSATRTLKCTASAKPWCASAVFPNVNATAYSCASASATTPTVYATAAGTWSEIHYSPGVTSLIPAFLLSFPTPTANSTTASFTTTSATMASGTTIHITPTAVADNKDQAGSTLLRNVWYAGVLGVLAFVTIMTIIGFALIQRARTRSRRGGSANGNMGSADTVDQPGMPRIPPPVYLTDGLPITERSGEVMMDVDSKFEEVRLSLGEAAKEEALRKQRISKAFGMSYK